MEITAETIMHWMGCFAFGHVVVRLAADVGTIIRLWRKRRARERFERSREQSESFRKLRERVRAEQRRRLNAEHDSTP